MMMMMEKRRESRLSICVRWLCDKVTGNEDDDGDSTATGDRDDARSENEKLCAEIDMLSRDHKKMKQIVEQLKKDYEESKDYDPLRRYERLKGMVKRTIMHIKLNPDEPNILGTVVGAKGLLHGCKELNHHAESARRREDKYSKMSRQDLVDENVLLLDQLTDWRRKFSNIRDLIEDLAQNYDASKRLAVMQRYNVLKEMVKTVINDELI